jgi:hypothetical protein
MYVICYQECYWGGHRWLVSIIQATQEAEIWRIKVRSQPEANSSLDPLIKEKKKTQQQQPVHKKKAGVVAPDVGSEFKPQYHKKQKNGY